MGLFDIFKKKKSETKEVTYEEGIHNLAYASMIYNEVEKDYEKYKAKLKAFGFDKAKMLHYSIGLVLHFYHDGNKEDALMLYNKLVADFPDHVDLNWLYIEVICTMNIKNDQAFVQQFRDLKKQKHDFNYQYEVEYQKGLELKSMNYYQEAIGIWTALNKIHEFSWNYYQIGILQTLSGDLNKGLNNIKKAIEMDGEIKEDAKTFFELDSLRTNPEFLKLLE